MHAPPPEFQSDRCPVTSNLRVTRTLLAFPSIVSLLELFVLELRTGVGQTGAVSNVVAQLRDLLQ